MVKGRFIKIKSIVDVPIYLVTVALLLHISLLFLPISNILPSYIYVCILMVSNLFFCLGLLYKAEKKFLLKILSVVFFCIIFDAFYIYAKYLFNSKILKHSIIMFQFWIPSLAALFYIEKSSAAEKKLLYHFILIILLVITAFTVIGLGRDPEASRQMAAGSQAYYRYNIGGYAHIYGLALLIPWLFACFRNNSKISYLIMSGFFLLCIVKAQFTLALLFALFGIGMTLVSKKMTIIKLLGWVIASGLLLFLCREIIADLFYFAGELLQRNHIDYMASRFWGYGDTIKNYASDGVVSRAIYMRLNVYLDSIKLFLKSPFFGGHGKYQIGGHSEIFDILGGMGIVGFALITSIWVNIYKSISTRLNQKWIRNTFPLIFGIYLLLSVANPTFNVIQLSYIVFLLPVLLDTKQGDERARRFEKKSNHISSQ